MYEAPLVAGLMATFIYLSLTFLRLRVSTLFTDFAVFLSSIIAAVALTIFPSINGFQLPLLTLLYINALWLYGIEGKTVSKKGVINPSLPRVFIGFILFVAATWISFSIVDMRLALIVTLASVILATYKMKTMEKKS